LIIEELNIEKKSDLKLIQEKLIKKFLIY